MGRGEHARHLRAVPRTEAECSSYVKTAKVCAGWWAGADRDPDAHEPAAPAWVPVTVHRQPLPGVEQGVLPIGRCRMSVASALIPSALGTSRRRLSCRPRTGSPPTWPSRWQSQPGYACDRSCAPSPTAPPRAQPRCRSPAARPGTVDAPPARTRHDGCGSTSAAKAGTSTTDPLPADEGHAADQDSDEAEEDDQEDEKEEAPRRTRSTRRRDEMPDLPTLPVEHRTVGRTFTDPEDRPRVPALDVHHRHPALLRARRSPAKASHGNRPGTTTAAPRWMRCCSRSWWTGTIQNLRRGAGYKVQYFAAVEPQTPPRPAPAPRGPRCDPAQGGQRRLGRVATCRSGGHLSTGSCSPSTTRERWPIWAGEEVGYVDPATGEPLPTWEQALDDLDADEDAKPLHVRAVGKQTDIKGLLGGTEDSDRTVRYLCKYLTKAVAETYADQPRHRSTPTTPSRREGEPVRGPHRPPPRPRPRAALLPGLRELAALRHPAARTPPLGCTPGSARSKAHDRECLGVGGRRALVSRHWTGKTLTEHKADRAAVVRQVLEAAGIEAPDADRLAADVLHTDGKPRFVWEDTKPDQRDYPAMIAASLREKKARRAQYDHAKTIAAQRESPPGAPVDSYSAIQQGGSR